MSTLPSGQQLATPAAHVTPDPQAGSIIPVSRLQPRRVAQYKIGDRDSLGNTVVYVYRSVDDYIVYKAEKDGIAALGYDLAPSLTAASVRPFSIYNKLSARTVFIPKQSRPMVQHDLAVALCVALDAVSVNDKADVTECFAEPARAIDEYGRQGARDLYAVSTMLSAMAWIALILVLLVYKTFAGTIMDELLRGAASGVVGALFSALFLSRTMRVENYYFSGVYFRLQGYSRILIGLIAGGATMAAIRAGIVLGFANDSVYLSIIFCLAAGFLEHRVPSLLENVGKDGGESAGGADADGSSSRGKDKHTS